MEKSFERLFKLKYMISLATTIHDPNAGMEWMSDKYLEELINLFDKVFLTSSPNTQKVYLEKLKSEDLAFNKKENNKIGINYFDPIKRAYTKESGYIFYCDFDRILHWVKDHSKELRQLLQGLNEKQEKIDYIVAQRTEKGYKEHQDSLYFTEQLPNKIISEKMEQTSQKDFLAGCFIFSNKAAEIVVNDGGYDNLAFFGSWPVLLKNKDVNIEYRKFKGLGWETPDWHREEVRQAGGIAEYRTKLNSREEWRKRVRMANEFVKEII
ncbi:MAG: hypothetical protein BRC22_02185 [Parcubacteria group bacterium QH_9_35_7]|nr:MAG: hypothetical protein BRC22_02185 [Parcubacteria group bacterium QH_9_35_7]